ncbi:MAG TPA: hypothetical protein VHY84_27430 [Bryobacteraceae bacterium]|jgi:hypothetical protein|nr:hypothetical protein [Bryobacteraceae bacterium]
MKQIIGALAIACACLIAPLRAQSPPPCTTLSDTLYSITSASPGPMTGTIDVSQTYSNPIGALLVVPITARITVVAGVVSWCGPPGNYAAFYTVRKAAPLTGNTTFTRYWTMPGSGPVTVQTIETATPPTPPIYTLSVSAPITYVAGVIGIPPATTAQSGYLAFADWNTFNGKQPALGFSPENAANKSIANGYAPLNASSDVPLANLPTIPSTQTSGFAAVATSGSASDLLGGTLPHARLPALLSADIPDNTANTSGNAATATALAVAPTNCGSGLYADAIAANGNLTCAPVQYAQLGGSVPAITGLSGDVSATGPGTAGATVNFIDGSTSALVHAAELDANAVLAAAGATSTLLTVGVGASNTGTDKATAIGPGANTVYAGGVNCSGAGYGNTGAIAIGYNAKAGCRNSIAISGEGFGPSFPTVVDGADSIGIGSGNTVHSIDTVMLATQGTDAPFGTPFPCSLIGNHPYCTAAGQIVFGGDQPQIYGGYTDLFLGPPVTNRSIADSVVSNSLTDMSINATGGGLGPFDAGNANNVFGSNLHVNAGKSTGNANGGTLFFATSPAGTSGSTPNALVNRLSIDSSGIITFLGFTGSGKVPVCSNSGVIYAGSNSGTPCP